MKKTYLGDSVYAEFDGFNIVLATDNGHDPRNSIVLEPEVLESLDRFRSSLNPQIEGIILPDELGASIKYAIQGALDCAEYCRKTCTTGAALISMIAPELSPDVQCNPYGGTFWFTVSKREDVQVLMKLAPRWAKNVWEGGIDYNANVDGVEFKIRTTDGALPPTCRLVEQDVEIPAKPAEPARTEKRMVVECVKIDDAGEAARADELRTEGKHSQEVPNFHD